MKKIKLLLLAVISIYAFSGVNMAYGFSVIKPVANTELPSTLVSSKYLNASEFVKLSVKEFSDLTGKKLNFFQRMSFKVTKMRMKHDLKKNPGLKITDYIDGDGSFRVDILWLFLGLILGPIGVLIAYLTKQESYKITSAWIGFGALVFVLLVFGKSLSIF
ncbi:MAG: hypothetical protein JWN83_2145 [Chitinophagaceae bacterium]|nr:hypothetical protein [Chitinophagaceae bacterium]